MRHHVRPFLSLLVLVCYLNACTTWQVQTAPTSSVLTNYAGDTIVGRGRDTTAVAIPLQEVREVAVKRTSVPRTALADCRDGSCGRWFGVGGHLCGVLQRLAHADLIGRTPAQLNDAAHVTPRDIAAAQEFWAYWGTPLLNTLLDAEAEPAGE